MPIVPAYFYLHVLVDSLDHVNEEDEECDLFTQFFDDLISGLFLWIPAGSFPVVRDRFLVFNSTTQIGEVVVRVLVSGSEQLFRLDENWDRFKIDFKTFRLDTMLALADYDKPPEHRRALRRKIRGFVDKKPVVDIYCSATIDEIILEIL